MATYYGSYVSSAFRSRADVTTSTSNTQVTISVTGYCQMADYYHDSGENFFRKIVIGSDTPNTYVTASTSYFSGGGTYGVGSSSRTYNRTHAAQSIEVGVAIHNDGTYTGWSTDDSYARTTVTVPAKPSYAVSFNANGGSGAPSAQTKWYGEALTLSSTKPTRTGYTFKNWNTKSDGTGTSYSAGGTVAAATNQALTLYAQWTAITYSVAYAANGGSSTPASQTKTYGVALTLHGAISHANATATYTVSYRANYTGGSNPSSGTATKTTKYTFNGWKATNGTTYAAGGSYTANAATTMTAQWTSKATTTSVTLPTPTRTGYTFGGWYKEPACTNKVGNGDASYTPTADATLYAKWTANTYTVAFKANGGSGAPSSQTKTYGVDLTLSSTKPTRTNYTFKSWNTKSDGSGTSYAAGAKYTTNAAATLYAQWTQNTWTVSYAANGGSSTPSSQSKVAGTALKLASAISHANATATITTTFNANGGSATGASGNKLTSTKTTSYSFTKWKATNGTLYSAGGSYTTDAATTMTAQWSSSNSYTTITLPTPTRTGYTFNGWYTAASGGSEAGKAGASHKPTADATLYAHWTIITHTVTLDPQGGSVSPASLTKTYGTALTLPTPTRTGCTFLGWNTAAAGTGTHYGTGSGGYTYDAGDRKLYAQWIGVSVSSFSVRRSNSNGVAQDDGTYARATANWSAVCTGTSGVTRTLAIKYLSGSTETTAGTTSTTGSYGITVGSGSTFAADTSYRFTATATVTWTYNGSSRSVSATRVATIPKVFRLLDALHGGTGLAIGAIATLANTFEVALSTLFQNVVEVAQGNITRDGTYTEPTNGDHQIRLVDSSRRILSYLSAHKAANSPNNYLRLTAYGPSGSKTANVYISASDTDGYLSTDADVTTLRSMIVDGTITSYGNIRKQSTTADIDSTTAPSSTVWAGSFQVMDKDGYSFAVVDGYWDTAMSTGARMVDRNKKSDGTVVENAIGCTVAKDGTRGYIVTDAAAFRKAINAVTSANQTTMEAGFSAGSGSQVFNIFANVINSSSAYSGKRVGFVITPTGLSLFNSTDQSTIWNITPTITSDSTGTGVVTAKSGFSVYTAGGLNRAYKRNGVATIYLGFKTTNALNAGGSYNIGTLNSGWRPSAMAGLWASGTRYGINASTQANGEIYITPTVAIPAGSTFYLGGTFVQA